MGLIYTGEMVSTLSGGVRRKTVYLDNMDLTLTLDVERLLGWPGARVFVYGLGNRGGNPSSHVGDAQGVSDIEAFDTWKLFEAWVEQQLFDARLSLLLGLYNLAMPSSTTPKRPSCFRIVPLGSVPIFR